MRKKLIGVVAVTTMAFIATVTAASAQTPPAYPPPPNGIRCLNNTELIFVRGQEAVFQANTFQAGADVTWTMFSAPVVLGTVAADANGFSTITTNIPLDAELGAHRVEATGVDRFGEALTLVLEITVLAQLPSGPGEPGGPGGPSGPLPRTGTDSTWLLQTGIAVLVAGGFLLVMANRRRAVVVRVDSTHSTQV